jgi:hypothetical protein
MVKNREKHLERWYELSNGDNLLFRIRAKQMIEIMKECHIEKIIPELLKNRFEKIVIYNIFNYTVYFLY